MGTDNEYDLFDMLGVLIKKCEHFFSPGMGGVM